MGWIAQLQQYFAPPLGKRGEDAAARHLRHRGHRILARNLKNRFGEIDLLTRAPDGAIVVVEVKSSIPGQPAPELRVNKPKQRRLIALAAQIARRYKLTNHRFRFDVVAVEIPVKGKPVIRHIENAFESHV